MSIFEKILHNKFLPVAVPADRNNCCFYRLDSEQQFKKSLNTQPSDWFYRTNTVRYTFNSEGYRAPEFNTIDWANSVVIFGCSMVLGTGIDDDDTVSSQLSKILCRPVINMGVAGSSIQHAVYNSAILAAGYPYPYAVIQLWSSIYRTMLITDLGVNNRGPWNANHNDFYDLWLNNDHPCYSAVLYRKISQQLWRDRSTRYLEGTMFEETASTLDNCSLFEHIDLGRDLSHPGIKTAARIAAHFAEQLK